MPEEEQVLKSSAVGERWMGRARQLRQIVTFVPFDTSTEAGRSKERYRRLALSATSASLSKGLSVLITVLAVPLTIQYLGADRYGIWTTVSSLVAIFAFADLGIGNGLVGSIARADSEHDRQGIVESVSSALAIVAGTACIMLIAWALLGNLVRWSSVIGVSSSPDLASEASWSCLLFFTLFTISLPVNLIQQVQLGFQEAFASNLWQALGRFLALGALIGASAVHANVPILIVATLGTPILVSAGNWMHQIRVARPWMRPRLSAVTLRSGATIMSSGGQFLIAQVGAAALANMPVLLVAHIHGPTSSAMLATTLRILSLPMTVNTVATSSLWPAYAEALARGDRQWVARTAKRSFVFTALFAVVPTLLASPCGPLLVSALSSGRIVPTSSESSAIGVLCALLAIRTTLAMLLLGFGKLRAIALYSPAMGMVAMLPLLLPPLSWSSSTIVWYIVAAEAITSGAMCLDLLYRWRELDSPLVGRSKGREASDLRDDE